MGTNYYWKENDGPKCNECGRFDEGKKIHIGKSSAGWCFSLHVTDEIKSLDDWKKIWDTDTGKIVDEYGDVLSKKEMLKIITKRSGKNSLDIPFGYTSLDHFHEKNYSETGPNNLARSKISDTTHCVGHGDGTWDLITGEFS